MVARRRVNDNSRRFVYHYNVIVLVQDVDRYRLGFKQYLFRGWNGAANLITCLCPISGLFCISLNPNFSIADQARHNGTGTTGNAGGD